MLNASAGKPYITESPADEINDIHLVIKQEGTIVGSLLMHPCSSNCVQMKQVVICQHHQGKNLGKRLIVYAEQIARKLNFSILFLTGRKQAWGFYEKMGYCDLMAPYYEDRLTLKVFKKELHTFPKRRR